MHGQKPYKPSRRERLANDESRRNRYDRETRQLNAMTRKGVRNPLREEVVR